MAKLKDRIRAAASRRKHNPHPAGAAHVKLEATVSERQRASQQHAGVLFSIESLFAHALREYDADDSLVAQTLRASILGIEPDHPISSLLLSSLQEAREAVGCSDETWQLCQRVIYRSVKTHSKCRPGDVDYLTFVAGFLPK